MGQTKSKSDPIDFYKYQPTYLEIAEICNLTDFDEDEIKPCWENIWFTAMKENGKVDYEHFVKYFCKHTEVSSTLCL